MKSKKILSCALAVMLSLGTLTVLPEQFNDKIGMSITADAASSSGLVLETDEDGYKFVSGYKGSGGEVVIPKDVSYIGNDAFKGNQKITSVVAKGDLYAWESAFEGCTKLQKVTVAGDAYFALDAFAFCVNLESVDIKGSIDECIGAGAFYYCSSLRSFRVAKSEYDYWIGEAAFYTCINLKNLDIKDGCTTIHHDALTNCVNLTEITIPKNTTFSTKHGKYPVGYSYGRLNEDFSEDGEYRFADGKTSVYISYYSTSIIGLYSYLPKEDFYGLYANLTKFAPKKITLNVYEGSKAQTFAKNNGISYKVISDEADELASPENIRASSKTKNSITLAWDKVKGADAYTVYMYNSSTGKYEEYKTVKSNSCVIKNLKKNTKYKFKVVALDKVNGKYKKGEVSDPVAITTKKK